MQAIDLLDLYKGEILPPKKEIVGIHLNYDSKTTTNLEDTYKLIESGHNFNDIDENFTMGNCGACGAC